jgi:FkbM family methyltransferase
MARKCARFTECYENASNYNFDTNGERFVLEALSSRSAGCVFDVGANVGDWMTMAHGNLPNASIHCFEIVAETASTLRARSAGIPAITVNAFGLSNHAGEVRIKCFPGYSALASMIDVCHEFASTQGTGRVVRGDDYCRERGIERIDFVKIDVEAAEWMVLEGFANMIRDGGIDVIQFEYGTGSIVTKFMLKDYYDFFAPHGYALGKIYPNYVEFRDYSFRHEDFAGPNFLAVRRNRDDLIRRLS